MLKLETTTSWLRAIVLFGLCPACLATAAEVAPSGDPIAVVCAELPSGSFPPNQLLREESSDRSAFSLMKASGKDQWAEFFVEVLYGGTYRVSVSFLKGPDRGICQMVASGDDVGDPVDLYAAVAGAAADISVGNITVAKGGNYSFRFVVKGKNASSSGSDLAMQKITLSPVKGFTLIAPSGACVTGNEVLLRWNTWPGAKSYRVELDQKTVATVDSPTVDYSASNLTAGAHRWRVIALDANGHQTISNTFSFFVGAPPPCPYRDYSEAFSVQSMENWDVQSMSLETRGNGHGTLRADGLASAYLKSVRLEKAEAEVSAQVTLGNGDTAAGVGFQADDGTRIYGVADVGRGQFRLERRVTGYSIFDVTPKAYRMKAWAERPEKDATPESPIIGNPMMGSPMIWELSAVPVVLHAGTQYQMKLEFSRRSSCVMATLVPSDGSETLTLRGLCDQRSPDHPVLVCLKGQAQFADPVYRHLNKLVYKWDPDTLRIVLRPGEHGSWDAGGAFNPAIIIRNGTWYMVYRGNAHPAPPNGGPSSDLGLATSTDGMHWTKSPANPIIRRPDGKGTVEDPDLLWPKDSNQVYLEYRSHLGEVMCSSTDWVHWSDPWVCNSGRTFGKMGGMIDTRQELGDKGVLFNGVSYRYITMIEEGRIDVSNDLKTWIKAGLVDLKGTPTTWCDGHECSGDIFVDHDKNIRFESQVGARAFGRKGDIVGNPLCTIAEGALSGSDPTKLLWRSDLPWLPDWYGDAPTGSPEDFTATNGSVFPGQTVIADGWLMHFSGGNNTFTIVSKFRYGPVWECRNLQARITAAGQCAVTAVVRNIGSLPGNEQLVVSVDGQAGPAQQVSLDHDAETIVHWDIPLNPGKHTLSVDDLSLVLQSDLPKGP